MKKASARIAKRISLPGAASLLVGTMLLAQLLGFFRTKLVNANFPLTGSESTDIYFAAFKIPDFFFYVLAAGVLGVVLIPILSDRLQKHDRRGIWLISNSLMNFMALITLAVGVFILIFAQDLMQIVAPNLTTEQLANATTILRLIAFNPLFFTISGILTSTQQVFGRFFFFAITPVVYNLAIIASIFVFKDSLGLVGLGVGAMIGGFLQLVLAFVGVIGLGFWWKPIIVFGNDNFKNVLRQLPARSLDQGVDSVNSIVETNRGSLLGEGVIASYENAFIIHSAPVFLIGSSISTAAFPRLTERLSSGRIDLFRKEFVGVLQTLMWLSVPVMIITYFARGYLARIVFTKGAPDIALILGLLSIAIFFRTIYTLLSRYFYAFKDTITPLIVSVFAIGLNIILVFALARPEAYGVAGLALAQSITSAAEVIVIGAVMVSRDRKILNADFWNMLLRLVSVSGFTILAAFIMLSIIPFSIADTGFFLLGGKLMVIAGVTFGVHVLVSALFGFSEAMSLLRRIRNLVYMPIRIYNR